MCCGWQDLRSQCHCDSNSDKNMSFHFSLELYRIFHVSFSSWTLPVIFNSWFGNAGLVSLQRCISVQSLPFSSSADTRQVSSSLTMEASRPDPGKIILSPRHITQISQRYHPDPQEAMSWNSTHEHVTLTPVKHLRYLIFNGRCYLHLTQW